MDTGALHGPFKNKLHCAKVGFVYSKISSLVTRERKVDFVRREPVIAMRGPVSLSESLGVCLASSFLIEKPGVQDDVHGNDMKLELGLERLLEHREADYGDTREDIGLLLGPSSTPSISAKSGNKSLNNRIRLDNPQGSVIEALPVAHAASVTVRSNLLAARKPRTKDEYDVRPSIMSLSALTSLS
ncbi:hypothetical protein Tco_1448845 [Tanacetum coccineum]